MAESLLEKIESEITRILHVPTIERAEHFPENFVTVVIGMPDSQIVLTQYNYPDDDTIFWVIHDSDLHKVWWSTGTELSKTLAGISAVTVPAATAKKITAEISDLLIMLFQFHRVRGHLVAIGDQGPGRCSRLTEGGSYSAELVGPRA